MNAVRRTLVLAAGLALGLMLGACGSKDNGCTTNPTGPGCPPPPTTLPAQTRNVIKTGSCTDLGVDFFLGAELVAGRFQFPAHAVHELDQPLGRRRLRRL